MAGLFDKRWGLSRSIRRAPLFYTLVAAGTIGGTLFSLLGANPITLLVVVVAVVNGLAAAPFLIVVMLVARDHSIMGDHANGRVANTLGWLTVALMTAAAIGLVLTVGH